MELGETIVHIGIRLHLHNLYITSQASSFLSHLQKSYVIRAGREVCFLLSNCYGKMKLESNLLKHVSNRENRAPIHYSTHWALYSKKNDMIYCNTCILCQWNGWNLFAKVTRAVNPADSQRWSFWAKSSPCGSEVFRWKLLFDLSLPCFAPYFELSFACLMRWINMCLFPQLAPLHMYKLCVKYRLQNGLFGNRELLTFYGI